MMKHCTVCGIEKPSDEFQKNKRMKDGRASACIVCTKKRYAIPETKAKRKAYNATPEAKAKRKAYYATPEVIAKRKAYQKAYYAAKYIQSKRRKL